MTTRFCPVRAHVRTIKAKPSPLDTPIHRQLREEVTLAEMDAELEAILSDPVFSATGGIVNPGVE